MKIKTQLRAIILSMVMLISGIASAQIFEPVKWNYSFEKTGSNEYDVIFNADIDTDWHLYSQFIGDNGPVKTTFTFNEATGYERIGEVKESGVITEDDPVFEMKLAYFENKAEFRQKIKVTTDGPVSVSGEIEFMCCDNSKCLPPTAVEFDITISNGSQAAPQKTSTGGENIWMLIIEAILWGFAALLTPCVFPMVPMTVSFFLKGSGSKAQGRFNALMYFLFIVLLYTVPIAIIILTTWIFGGDSVTADIFNWLATHWLPNIVFFIVFMVFAASFFGAFEITLNNNLVNKADEKSGRKGLVGVFFMALTLVLVSFACTGPIVGTVLIKSTSGEFWTPIVTMFAFSVAFALPFTLFALFPSLLKNLPKSGGWLNSVKVVLGFIEVALGFKFLSVADQTYHWGLLDREVYLGIWIVCFTMMGFYLLGKLRFKHDDDLPYISVGRLVLSIISFTFVIYMIPGMWGAPLKALSGYLPPQQTMDFDLNRIIRENSDRVIEETNSNLKTISFQSAVQQESTTNDVLCETPKYADFLHLPHGLQGFFDYNQAVECAKAQNKPIYVDFTGHGCVNCREMEANVWSDPRVLKMLREEYVVVALYVDDKKALSKDEWTVSKYDGKTKKTIGRKNADFQISNFATNAQPYYVLMGHNGEVLVEPRAYNLDRDAFVDFLQRGLDNFRNGSSVRNINK